MARSKGCTYGIEDAGAFIMVNIGVKIVDTNSIHTQNLHQGGIAKASVRVPEGIIGVRIIECGAPTRLIRHTGDLELVSSFGVDEFIALNLNRRNSGDKGCGQSRDTDLDLY